MNTEEQIEFLQSKFIGETGRLIESGFPSAAFLFIAQGIESLGAFLDKKPFKCPSQGKARFNKALAELFPPPYSKVNGDGFLYSQLRSSLTHLGFAGKHIKLCTQKQDGRHLKVIDKQTVIAIEPFYDDFVRAVSIVLQKLENGEIRPKFLPI